MKEFAKTAVVVLIMLFITFSIYEVLWYYDSPNPSETIVGELVERFWQIWIEGSLNLEPSFEVCWKEWIEWEYFL